MFPFVVLLLRPYKKILTKSSRSFPLVCSCSFIVLCQVFKFQNQRHVYKCSSWEVWKVENLVLVEVILKHFRGSGWALSNIASKAGNYSVTCLYSFSLSGSLADSIHNRFFTFYIICATWLNGSGLVFQSKGKFFKQKATHMCLSHPLTHLVSYFA